MKGTYEKKKQKHEEKKGRREKKGRKSDQFKAKENAHQLEKGRSKEGRCSRYNVRADVLARCTPFQKPST
jgi:hypothetical protein